MSQLTIHRALALKKTTEERISNEIVNAKYIEIRQGKKGTIKGDPVEKVESNIRASFDKINQLISNYGRLKAAILQSNAGVRSIPEDLHKVTVAGKDYTMAELISASDEIYGNKKHRNAFKAFLLTAMKNAYADATRRIETQHERIESDIKDYLAKAAATDKGMTSDEIKKRSDMFHEDGDYVLVDPLNLKEAIEKLEAEIKTFRADCDATMSEQNALTTIEVDLTDVD
jgi:hypothetical protein